MCPFRGIRLLTVLSERSTVKGRAETCVVNFWASVARSRNQVVDEAAVQWKMVCKCLMNSEKQPAGEEAAPGPSGSLQAASRFALAASAPADKSGLNLHNLLQVLLKLLFHLQQKDRRVLSQAKPQEQDEETANMYVSLFIITFI